MSRSKPFRHRPSLAYQEAVALLDDQRIFLVQTPGPLSFVVQDGAAAAHQRRVTHRVTLGANIHCTCGTDEGEHCLHSVYVLHKVLRLPLDSPIAWQVAFTDRELNHFLTLREEHLKAARARALERANAAGGTTASAEPGDGGGHGHDQGRVKVEHKDRCPICQEHLVPQNKRVGVERQASREGKRPPQGDAFAEGEGEGRAAIALEGLTWCKGGCGQNFHASCMKIWAQHRTSLNEAITCPMCRVEWSPEVWHALLDQVDQPAVTAGRNAGQRGHSPAPHFGWRCRGCGMAPVRGPLFHCLVCPKTHLCLTCYRKAGWEGEGRDDRRGKGRKFECNRKHHPYIVKRTPKDCWHSASRLAANDEGEDGSEAEEMSEYMHHFMEALQYREVEPSDFDVLTLLAQQPQPRPMRYHHPSRNRDPLPSDLVERFVGQPPCLAQPVEGQDLTASDFDIREAVSFAIHSQHWELVSAAGKVKDKPSGDRGRPVLPPVAQTGQLRKHALEVRGFLPSHKPAATIKESGNHDGMGVSLAAMARQKCVKCGQGQEKTGKLVSLPCGHVVHSACLASMLQDSGCQNEDETTDGDHQEEHLPSLRCPADGTALLPGLRAALPNRRQQREAETSTQPPVPQAATVRPPPLLGPIIVRGRGNQALIPTDSTRDTISSPSSKGNQETPEHSAADRSGQHRSLPPLVRGSHRLPPSHTSKRIQQCGAAADPPPRECVPANLPCVVGQTVPCRPEPDRQREKGKLQGPLLPRIPVGKGYRPPSVRRGRLGRRYVIAAEKRVAGWKP
ncbi:unnamed protein product [Vitrella brassicaformis CCMP3155]|uniref:RING-type domain-containing protein n=3 Tax=Vitrella brassicaformis TaxID=1169539 RepID=A0A0G4EBG5_VITBC|nr:unnamed protein product [Vitrella brassicaformis CCMP3155]|eukprot:CEL93308.1 unnamed protein product [Vitrella brassicaformis CCMP3155]